MKKALRQRRRAFELFASERSFVGLWRLRGSVGLRFAAIEPAYDISADGPRRNLRGLRLLAFAVRLFVGRADERAFDEYVGALLDGRGDTLCQKWPENNDPMPLGFRAPFVICVLPRALCGDRRHGEFRTVAFRLTLLRVRTNEPDESYRGKTFFESPFSAPFSWSTQKRGLLLPKRTAALWEGHVRFGRNRESRRREAAGCRN